MYDRISDSRLIEILDTRTCPALPGEVCTQAYGAMRRLLAAREWNDVLVKVAALPDDRFAIHVLGKWVLVFTWIAGQGARELALQRV